MGLRPKPRQRKRLPLESPRALPFSVCCVLLTERRPFSLAWQALVSPFARFVRRCIVPPRLSMGLRPKPRQRECLPLESPRMLAFGVCCVLSTERRPFSLAWQALVSPFPFALSFCGFWLHRSLFMGFRLKQAYMRTKTAARLPFVLSQERATTRRGTAPLPCLFCCPRRFYRRLPVDGSSCLRSVCTRRPLSARPSATPTPPCTNRLNGSAASAGAMPYNTLSKAK